jgi:hypothetical protein
MAALARYTMKLLIPLLLFSSCVLSRDYLEPEDSLYTGIFLIEYEQMVLHALREADEREVLVRAFVFPSFRPEYAIGIRKNEESHTIFKVSPKVQLWGYESLEMMKNEQVTVLEDGSFVRDVDGIKALEEAYPENYLDVPLVRCDAEVESDLANDIVALWEQMLFETRYEKSNSLGMDGTTYHFSMQVGFQTLAGKTWSPNNETRAGKLVALTHAMSAYCEESSERNFQTLEYSKTELKNALQNR